MTYTKQVARTPEFYLAGNFPFPGWADDAFMRLAWLYGDPIARERANAPDVAAWNALGRKAVAAA